MKPNNPIITTPVLRGAFTVLFVVVFTAIFITESAVAFTHFVCFTNPKYPDKMLVQAYNDWFMDPESPSDAPYLLESFYPQSKAPTRIDKLTRKSARNGTHKEAHFDITDWNKQDGKGELSCFLQHRMKYESQKIVFPNNDKKFSMLPTIVASEVSGESELNQNPFENLDHYDKWMAYSSDCSQHQTRTPTDLSYSIKKEGGFNRKIIVYLNTSKDAKDPYFVTNFTTNNGVDANNWSQIDRKKMKAHIRQPNAYVCGAVETD